MVSAVEAAADDRGLPAAPEARVDDVVEDRSERVLQPEVEEVLVAGEQLALPQEDLFGTRLSARQIDLIARPRELAEEIDREALEQADVRAAVQPEGVLAWIREVLLKVELRVRAPPGLTQAETHFGPLIQQLRAQLPED